MNSEKNGPQDLGIIPVDHQSQTGTLSLSMSQKRVVSDMVTPYLRRNIVSFSRENIESAVTVLAGDALFRGLLLLNPPRDYIKPSDNVKKIIQAGLVQREEIQKNTRSVIQEYNTGIATQKETFIGAYALPLKLLTNVARENRQFSIVGDVSDSEKLLGLIERRQTILPDLFNLALSVLPKERFPKATGDTFPDPDSQVKIVRNMVLSLIFRGNPIPIINVDDFSRFVGIAEEDLEQVFSSDRITKIAEFISEQTDSPHDTMPYIINICGQINDAFIARKHHKKIIGDRNPDIEARDYLFDVFSSKFMLLHPALEEQELIVNPADADSENYSLWHTDFSVVIGNERVPTVDALKRAERLHEARGLNVNRFRLGVRAWSIMNAEKSKDKGERRTRLGEQMKKIDIKIKNLRDKNNQDIRVPTSYVSAKFPDFSRKIFSRRVQTRAAFAHISKRRKYKKMAIDYFASLVKHHGDSLPDMVNMPGVLEKEAEAAFESKLKNESERFYENVWYLTDMMRNDLFSASHILDPLYSIDEVVVSDEKTNEYIAKLVDGKSQLSDMSISQQEAVKIYDQIMVRLQKEREDLEVRRGDRSYRLIFSERIRLSSLKSIQERLEKHEGSTEDKVKLFYRFCIDERIDYLELVSQQRVRLQRVQERIFRPEWTKEAAADWYREMSLGCPEDSEYSIQDIEKWFSSVEALYDALQVKLGDLPDVIPQTKEELSEFIKSALYQLSEYNVVGKKSYDHRRRVTALENLISVINTPLFPIEDLFGVNKRSAMRTLKLRVRYFKSLLDLEREGDYENERKFKILAKREYRKALEKKKKELAINRVKLLSNHLAEEEFLVRMRKLNLVRQENVS